MERGCCDRFGTFRRQTRKLLLGAIQERPLKSTIVHDIYLRPTARTDLRGIDAVLRRAGSSTFFVVATHGDHCHIIHDCTYTSGQCRCSQIRKIEDFFCATRRKRYAVRQYQFGLERCLNTLFYLDKGGRQIRYLQIGRKAWSSSAEIRRHSLRVCCRERQKSVVEGSHVEDHDQLLREFGIS